SPFDTPLLECVAEYSWRRSRRSTRGQPPKRSVALLQDAEDASGQRHFGPAAGIRKPRQASTASHATEIGGKDGQGPLSTRHRKKIFPSRFLFWAINFP